MDLLTGGLLLVVGIIVCFFGLRFYRLVLALLGFVVGFYSASGALAQQSDIVQISGAVVAGLMVAVLFWLFYKFGYALVGVFLGLAVAALIVKAFSLSDAPAIGVALILTIVGAILGVVLADIMIRIGTAFSGATQIAGGIAALATAASISLPLVDPTHGSVNVNSTAGIATIVLVAVLGALGFLYQSRQTPRTR